MQTIADIIELSHEFGTPHYVLGGGGNTSCKDADSLWVKPSGTTLAGLQPEQLVMMNRVAIAELYEVASPEIPREREVLVKDLMAAAVCPGSSGRPSVEAPLHDSFPYTYVVHTHPAWVNGLTCAQDGAAACKRLFPQAMWVPYVDPGYTLCMVVRNDMLQYAAREGQHPQVVILQNHGIFIDDKIVL
jgi:rhamnose utilization protein RhaD (predicted bifunctional aldolase and dehydrogenase)